MASSSSTSLSAISVPSRATNLTKASQIPQYCIELLEVFEKLPLFTGRGALTEKCKILPLEKEEDARICGIFTENANRFLENKGAWPIWGFVCSGMNQISDATGKYIKQGVCLTLYDEVERCSVENLQAIYNQVFKSMVTGWVAAKLEDHPDIMFKKNTEEFALFIKEKSLHDEDRLIGSIINRLALQEHVKCNNQWLKHPAGYKHDKCYLWIRKSVMSAVIEKIGFQF